MKEKIENLDEIQLLRTYKRLKKNSKGFSSLIVRDPLDFLDFEADLKSNLKNLIFDINCDNYQPKKPYLHLSAKSKGINRPTVVFDIRDSLVYRFCIEQIEDVLFAKTRNDGIKNIRGSVKISPNKNPKGGDYYEKWFDDWSAHNADIRKSLKEKRWLVCTDIASYFENINVLVLKDLLRSDVEGKTKLLNLLFYFLENTRFRIDYEVNTFTGLPQEDIDCSRILAYYYLHPHDAEMKVFCSENDALFYRFVDDMNVAVNTEALGKKALKTITESLRKLNLVSSIEKTAIYRADDAEQELFFKENEKLNKFEASIIKKIRAKKPVKTELASVIRYYEEDITKKESKKNWIKVLKRFYTIFTYTNSSFFFTQIKQQIRKYPILFSDEKYIKYLVATQKEKQFNKLLNDIIDYLYSQENLYAALESNILESFLVIDPKNISSKIQSRLASLSEDIIFKKNYKPLSDYARSLACLLAYRFNSKAINKLGKHYLNSLENDYLFKKYLIIVSLTTSNHFLRNDILNKAKTELDSSISRFINFISNIDTNQKLDSFQGYINKKPEIYLLYKKDFSIIKTYQPVRVEILKKITSIYSNKTLPSKGISSKKP